MARRLIGFALIPLAGLSFLAPALPAGAAEPARVVVLTVDGTSIQDWTSAGAFESFRAAGLLATRTHTDSKDAVVLRRSAYVSLGAGAAAQLKPGRRPVDAGRGVLAGALGEALEGRGLVGTALGDASGTDATDAPAALAAMRADGTVATGPATRVPAEQAPRDWSRPDQNAPGGRRTDYAALRKALESSLGWASVVVVDLGDTARADRTFADAPVARRAWIARALDDADRFATEVGSLLGPKDLLVVASIAPPVGRVRAGAYLGAVAFSRARGFAVSDTTRRPGVISLTDLAPTFLRYLHLPIPLEIQGRHARVVPHRDATADAAAFDDQLVRALAARRPLTRAWLIGAAALAAAAFLTVIAGRGRAPGRERFPRRWRDTLATLLLAVAVTPAAALVAPRLPGTTATAQVIWTFALAIGLGLGARAAVGHERALLAMVLLDTVLLAGDLALGSPLASRSGLGFQIAGGGRFYGIDEGLLGVMLAAPLVAAGVALDRIRDRHRVMLVATYVLTIVAALASAPWFGAKFGAPFTLLPAFGVFAVLMGGRRPDRVDVIAIACATVFVAASFVAVDALRAPEQRSHIGREVTGSTPVSALVWRKLTGLVRVTGTTVWLPVALMVAGSAAALAFRRPMLAARGFWAKPGRRAGLWALATGSVLALGSNDTGIMTAACALAIGAAAFYEPFLAPDVPD